MDNTTTALFNSGDKYILVSLEEDIAESASADAVARGYRFIGSIAIVDDEPRVSIEPGCGAVMFFGGAVYAQWLGPRLKEYQLWKQAELNRGVGDGRRRHRDCH